MLTTQAFLANSIIMTGFGSPVEETTPRIAIILSNSFLIRWGIVPLMPRPHAHYPCQDLPDK